MREGFFRIHAGTLSKDFSRLVSRAAKLDAATKIMSRQAGVYTSSRPLREKIANRLGWVDIASSMQRRITDIETFGEGVIKDGMTQVLLMGMGGSSLCPEVFKLFNRKHPKLKSFDVLDSTDPAAVQAMVRKLDVKSSFFIVASKSGGTVETRSHEATFLSALKTAGVRNPGRHFAAITDKGSDLEAFARRNKYRKVFVNPSDIGGRYSALSYFGLVPGFFAGVKLEALLQDAVAMELLLRERNDESNPAVVLGSLMAAGAMKGRDKLTFLASPKTAPLVPWIEQLIAESTGKKGKGVIPIDNEPKAKVGQYGSDRLFVAVRMSREKTTAHDTLVRDIRRRKLPLVEIGLGSKHELGRQFLIWELATAIAGLHLGINPFDEPNVTESKNNTKALLQSYEKSGQLPFEEPLAGWGKLSLMAAGGKGMQMSTALDAKHVLKKFFTGVKPPRYVALLDYARSDKNTEKAMERIRRTIRDKRKVATLRGYGPRFLHSIGQLYKGGPGVGLFVVFVRRRYGRMEIPGQPFDFGTLIRAQAIGDAQALISRKLPTLVIACDGKPSDGLEQFARLLATALR